MDRQMWALTTDFWRSRGWQLAGTLLLPMLLPLLIYGPLYVHLKYDWQHDPSTVVMHVVLTGIMTLCIVATLLTWSNSLGREYTLPISTWKLVLTRSLGGAWVAATACGLACLTAKWLFQVPWPLLGPVLLIITVYLAAQAVHWLTMQSPALGLLLFAPFCLLAAWWFRLRYEPGGLSEESSQYLRMWTHVTGSEWVTLLLVGGGGVWGSYHAARLQRMGCGPTWARLLALGFGEKSHTDRTTRAKFTNFQSALGWREWRERGRAIPILFATAALIHGALWWLLGLNTQEAGEIFGGFSMLGTWSFIAWGIYLGMRSKRQNFPSFDATRPITDAQWSVALLRSMTRSTLLACGVWALGAGLIGAIAWGLEGESAAIALSRSLGGEFAHFNLTDFYSLVRFLGELAALVGLWVLVCWTLAANGMMLALLRRGATLALLPGGIALFVLTMLVTTVWVPQHLQGIVAMSLWGTFFTGLLVMTLVSFLVAWRRKLIGRSTCLRSLALWLTLAAGILCWMINQLPQTEEKLFAGFMLSSLLLLPFLPLAGTPLAVAWNRHR